MELFSRTRGLLHSAFALGAAGYRGVSWWVNRRWSGARAWAARGRVSMAGRIVGAQRVTAALTERPVVGYTVEIVASADPRVGRKYPRHVATVSELSDFYVENDRQRVLVRGAGAVLSAKKKVKQTRTELRGMPPAALRQALEAHLYDVGSVLGYHRIEARELRLQPGSLVRVAGLPGETVDPDPPVAGYREAPMVQTLSEARIKVLSAP